MTENHSSPSLFNHPADEMQPGRAALSVKEELAWMKQYSHNPALASSARSQSSPRKGEGSERGGWKEARTEAGGREKSPAAEGQVGATLLSRKDARSFARETSWDSKKESLPGLAQRQSRREAGSPASREPLRKPEEHPSLTFGLCSHLRTAAGSMARARRAQIRERALSLALLPTHLN